MKKIKIKKPLPDGFVAAYWYNGSFGRQKIMIKYEDDARAIDLLLANGLQRQAIEISDKPFNRFTK